MRPTVFSHFREDPRDPDPMDHDPERLFGFRLTLREDGFDSLVLHGQLVGIGRGGRSAGNYSGEDWLIEHGPENGGPIRVDYWKPAEDGHPNYRERIFPATGQAQFDSESGEFFCYVSDVQTAEQIVTALKRYMDTVETTYGASAMAF